MGETYDYPKGRCNTIFKKVISYKSVFAVSVIILNLRLVVDSLIEKMQIVETMSLTTS
jgi:hypothetical protein